MKVCIIIPVFNEQDFIKKSVESLINQTIKPAEVIYVNDNSTDNSKNIIKNLIGKCEWIRVIDHKSFQEHVPGSKVIEAFNFGLKNLETQFDIICKSKLFISGICLSVTTRAFSIPAAVYATTNDSRTFGS